MTGKFKVASSRKHALIKGHGKRVDKAEHSGKRAKLCAKVRRCYAEATSSLPV